MATQGCHVQSQPMAIHQRDEHLGFEQADLPLHEAVVQGVGISGDKAAPPVHSTAQAGNVPDCQGREVAQPVLSLPAVGSAWLLRLHAAYQRWMSEAAPPVLPAAQAGDVPDCQGREVVQPVLCLPAGGLASAV